MMPVRTLRLRAEVVMVYGVGEVEVGAGGGAEVTWDVLCFVMVG